MREKEKRWLAGERREEVERGGKKRNKEERGGRVKKGGKRWNAEERERKRVRVE